MLDITTQTVPKFDQCIPLPDQVAAIDFRYLWTMTALLVVLKLPYHGNRCVHVKAFHGQKQAVEFLLLLDGPGAPAQPDHMTATSSWLNIKPALGAYLSAQGILQEITPLHPTIPNNQTALSDINLAAGAFRFGLKV